MRALRPRQNVRRAIQVALIELTLDCVRQLMGEALKPLSDRAVHEIRTRIKRMRALLRLARATLGAARYEQVKRRLRRTSRALARARDARTMLTTCQRLLQHRDPAYRSRFSLPLRERLKEARIALSPRKRRALAMKLLALRQSVASWPESEAGWKMISRGLRREYAEAHKAFATVQVRPSDARLHELRKRSKGLFYMCEFIGKRSPHAHATAKRLKPFTDCLGAVHDLSVLTRAVSSRRLERLADSKQLALRRRAWALGARIYDESAGQFTKRAHEEWKKRR